MNLSGRLGDVYRVEGSLDMSAWAPLTLLTNRMGSVQWTDFDSGATRQKYYRAVLVP
jgi:hypothetical protein